MLIPRKLSHFLWFLKYSLIEALCFDKQRLTSISQILFGDQQMNMVEKDFYKDNSFCRDVKGNINLWKLYNLFTGSNKSSYIDSFLDRSVNAFAFIEQVRENLEESCNSWYLN